MPNFELFLDKTSQIIKGDDFNKPSSQLSIYARHIRKSHWTKERETNATSV